jgi:hypothetical protein
MIDSWGNFQHSNFWQFLTIDDLATNLKLKLRDGFCTQSCQLLKWTWRFSFHCKSSHCTKNASICSWEQTCIEKGILTSMNKLAIKTRWLGGDNNFYRPLNRIGHDREENNGINYSQRLILKINCLFFWSTTPLQCLNWTTFKENFQHGLLNGLWCEMNFNSSSISNNENFKV